MKMNITVFHMNEGHSAFLAMERIVNAMTDHKLPFREALEFVAASNVFTTHTPVPAGNDRFTPDLIDKYLSHCCKKLGITPEEFLALGRENPGGQERDLLHDRSGHQAIGLLERGFEAARQRIAQHVEEHLAVPAGA